MKKTLLIMVSLVMMITVLSCQKDTPLLDDESINIADDDAVAEAIFDDLFSTADNASIIAEAGSKDGDSKSGTFVLADSCPVVTVTTTGGALWPRTVTVDYGTGCTGLNDVVRKGKIIIEVSAPRFQTGATRTVTLVDYFINDIKVEGTKVIETEGLNENQNPVFSVQLTGGRVILPDGKIIEREVNHEREWIAGHQTWNIWDDECLITGTATGVNINGIEYTNTIMTALHWTRACRFLVSGVLKIEATDKEPVAIDFGTGDCDAKAVVTRGDESREITLKYRHRTMN